MTNREKRPLDRGPMDDFDSRRRAREQSERKWLIGAFLTLGLVITSLSLVYYMKHRAEALTDQADHARLVQYQARLVADVKAGISDEAYRSFQDQLPDQLSPVMQWGENTSARALIEYELFPSDTLGVIHHLYNTPAEREALVHYLERIWGQPWDKISETMVKRYKKENQENDIFVQRLRQRGKL